MKYTFTGKYREYRGYQFIDGRPVDITDRATLAAIAREPDFKPVEVEEKPVETVDACPKCGRIIKQGRYMHVKFCRGGK